MIAPDTTLGARFSSNHLVTSAPNIRAYMGQPLSIESSVRLGSLCITAQGSIQVTVSMGAACITPSSGDTLENFIKKADDELRKAKKNGKGRIEIAA